MIKQHFELLGITRQQEIIETEGKFMQTQAIGNYICDTYQYDDYFVIFFCLIAHSGEPNCRCFENSNHIQLFINSIDRPMS